MRLGLRVSLLIGNIQICVLGYILQLRPIISFHVYVRVLRITHWIVLRLDFLLIIAVRVCARLEVERPKLFYIVTL